MKRNPNGWYITQFPFKTMKFQYGRQKKESRCALVSNGIKITQLLSDSQPKERLGSLMLPSGLAYEENE